ncbi:MAG: hypothetical protein FJX33_11810 [Alphaproteobacteria bacterium]|nr:hypothetical protein [Alphaproteobacteria bacterium]
MQFYLAGVIGSLLLRTACTEQAPPPVMSPASVVTRSDIQKVAYMTLDAATIVAAAIFLIFQDRETCHAISKRQWMQPLVT